MSSSPSRELHAWLTRICADITEDGAYSKYELLHNVEGEPGECIDTWPASLDAPRIADELAREIWEAANQDADSRVTSLPERYTLRAFRRSTEIHEAQFSFLIQSRRAILRYGSASEPATEKGALAYSMRHAENAFRLMAGAGDALIGRLKSEVERESRLRIEADEKCIKMMAECQALLDLSSQRRIDEAKALMREKRIDEVLAALTPIIPVIVEKLVTSLGASRLPEASPRGPALEHSQTEVPMLERKRDPVVEELMKFVNQLSPEEMQTIQAGLEPKKALIFAEVLKAIAEGTTSPVAIKFAVQKFLKSLSEHETLAIFKALSQPNGEKLMRLYAHFRALEEAEQAKKPELLRS